MIKNTSNNNKTTKREQAKQEAAARKAADAACISLANQSRFDALNGQWHRDMAITKNLVGVTALKARGWNDKLIAQLGDPERWTTNPYYSSRPLRALYSVHRVFEFESDNQALLNDNILKKKARQQKYAENPPKKRKPTDKQMRQLRDDLCNAFCSAVRAKGMLNQFYKDIKTAALADEPWSSITKVFDDFAAQFNAAGSPITIAEIDLRELQLGKSALCSFVFCIENGDGIRDAILDWIEFKTPKASPVVDALSQAGAIARAEANLNSALSH